jgi:hypothetical protein
VKVALYSALFGRYDRPKVVPPDLGVPAFMLTDDDETGELATAAGWNTVMSKKNVDMSPMMRHKWFKLHPHLTLPDFDVTLWMDASMTIVADDYVGKCLTALGDDDWVMVPHPSRICIYDEATVSASYTWKYDPAQINPQAEYYRIIGHPAQWGLFATGANVRRKTDTVRLVCEQWWWENTTRSHQDQISLPVLMRLNPDLKWNANMPWFEWWHLAEHGW